MPQLDYALLCDYVRPEATGVSHVIGAGIDTVYAAQVPTGHNLGVLARFTFTQGETDRPHRLELFFRNTDGQEFAKIEAVVVPTWDTNLPAGWMVGAQLGLNFGVPLPDYGLYAFELMMDDSSMKSMNLRVVPPPAGQGDAET